MNTGFSYGDSNPFPQELKNYFRENPEANDTLNLESFFDKNPSVRTAFVDWARNHQNLVEYTPRLYYALDLATPSEEYEVLAKSINSLSLALFNDGTAKIIQQLLILDPKEGLKLPNNFLKESIELYSCGIIDKNQLLRLIDCLAKTSQHNPFTSQFEKEIPDFGKLEDFDLILRIFESTDSKGLRLLDSPVIIEKISPFLMGLASDELLKLLNHQPLQINKIQNSLFPLLFKLDRSQLFSGLKLSYIFEMLKNPTEPEKIWQLFFREDFIDKIFNNFMFPDLLFSLKNSEGKDILDHPKYSKMLSDYLEKKPEKELINALIIEPRLIRFIKPLINKNNTEISRAFSLIEKINLKNVKNEDLFLFFVSPYGMSNKEKINKFIPLLDELPAEQLLSLLSIRNLNGGTPLHYSTSLEALLPLLKKLEPDQLLQLLTMKNLDERSPLYYPACVDLLTPLLHNFDSKDLLEIFVLKDVMLQTPLFTLEIFNLLLPFIKKLNSDEISQILTKDFLGNNILHKPEIVKNLLPILENSFRTEHLVALFCETNNKGISPLRNPSVFDQCLPLLNKLRPESFSQLVPQILMKDSEGNNILHNPLIVKNLLPILENSLDADLLITLFTETNKKGVSPLHNSSVFDLCLPLLNKLKPESLDKLFSIQFNNGNTLLHNPQIYQLAKPLFAKLNPKVFEIKNDDGFKINDVPSMTWITKGKEGITTPLSEEEYLPKAAEIKTHIDTLWKTFIFGIEEGQIPADYLQIDQQIQSQEELDKAKELIKQKLDVMLNKVVERTAWVGTPPALQKEALLQFYTPMVLNLERILELWKNENSSLVKAGTLIDFAKIELEGRCAAAYQAEIEQTKTIIESTHSSQSKSENLSMDSVFTKIAQTCLVKCIETIVKQNYSGDVHAYNQFLYAVGLQPVPDPLTTLTLETCYNKIVDQWTVANILHDFLEGFSKVDFNTALYWFEQVTPDEFGKELLDNLPKAEAMEQTYLKEASEQLGGNLRVLKIFQSPEGASLKPLAQLPTRKFVSEIVYDQLTNVSSLADMKAIEAQQKQDMESLSNRRRELVIRIGDLKKIPIAIRNEAQEKELQSALKEQGALQQQSIGIANEFNRLKTGTLHKIKLKELLEKSGLSLSPDELSHVIDIKKAYDNKISELADKLDINFNPEQGSLSNAIKFNRKLEFAKQFFTNNKLNPSGALFILRRIGVIE